MKNSLATAAIITLSFTFTMGLGLNVAAQSRGAQRTQVAMAGSGHTDLNTTLIDLDRVSQATQSDIANMHVEKWKAGWKSGFLKDGAHKDQAQQAANSLQRNLANALPGLIHEVQSSRGGLSATFKLYDDVSLVCEAVDSLISASEIEGKKAEAATLTDDYSAMARIRRSLSNYIQQSSAAMESRGAKTYAAVAAPAPQRTVIAQAPQRVATAPAAPQIVMDQGVKKIIVDDTVPEKAVAAPAAKKKPAAATLTNLE
jgi:hypothetical protein